MSNECVKPETTARRKKVRSSPSSLSKPAWVQRKGHRQSEKGRENYNGKKKKKRAGRVFPRIQSIVTRPTRHRLDKDTLAMHPPYPSYPSRPSIHP